MVSKPKELLVRTLESDEPCIEPLCIKVMIEPKTPKLLSDVTSTAHKEVDSTAEDKTKYSPQGKNISKLVKKFDGLISDKKSDELKLGQEIEEISNDFQSEGKEIIREAIISHAKLVSTIALPSEIFEREEIAKLVYKAEKEKIKQDETKVVSELPSAKFDFDKLQPKIPVTEKEVQQIISEVLEASKQIRNDVKELKPDLTPTPEGQLISVVPSVTEHTKDFSTEQARNSKEVKTHSELSECELEDEWIYIEQKPIDLEEKEDKYTEYISAKDIHQTVRYDSEIISRYEIRKTQTMLAEEKRKYLYENIFSNQADEQKVIAKNKSDEIEILELSDQKLLQTLLPEEKEKFPEHKKIQKSVKETKTAIKELSGEVSEIYDVTQEQKLPIPSKHKEVQKLMEAKKLPVMLHEKLESLETTKQELPTDNRVIHKVAKESKLLSQKSPDKLETPELTPFLKLADRQKSLEGKEILKVAKENKLMVKGLPDKQKPTELKLFPTLALTGKQKSPEDEKVLILTAEKELSVKVSPDKLEPIKSKISPILPKIEKLKAVEDNETLKEFTDTISPEIGRAHV